MTTVTVCVGSSCHVKGARDMIEKFNELIISNDLNKVVELKGCFCMERCGQGVNWQVDDDVYTSSTVEEAVKLFKEIVVEPNMEQH